MHLEAEGGLAAFGILEEEQAGEDVGLSDKLVEAVDKGALFVVEALNHDDEEVQVAGVVLCKFPILAGPDYAVNDVLDEAEVEFLDEILLVAEEFSEDPQLPQLDAVLVEQ